MRVPPRRIRTNLEQDEKSYGVAVQLPSPEIVEIVGYTGYDFAWIDAEHGSLDYSEIRELIRAADAAGIDSLVRVQTHDPAPIAQVLDLGATGILVPDVRSVEDAQAIAAATRFAPGGTRGACPCGRAVGHLTQDWVADSHRLDAEVFAFGIIEHRDGVENVEAIARDGGLDGLMFGPFDLSMALGLDGDIAHPEIRQMWQRVIEATRAAGIQYISPNAGWEEDLEATGARIIAVTGDRVALVNSLAQMLAEAGGAPSPAPSIA